MKLLIDTNVLIPLEPGSKTDLEPKTQVAAELLRTAQQVGATIYLHPIQRKDIEQDKDADRRALRLRLIEKYLHLPTPPVPSLALLAEIGNPPQGTNGWIDAHLIAALDRDLVDILVTEDQGIHKRCVRISRASQCRTISQALARLQDDLPAEPTPLPAVQSLLAHELNDADPIFASFRGDYPKFDTDQPSAALVKDLKQRGLLDDTLVIWGGEFGRTPFCQGDINDKKTLGRDHHPYVFTIWMAGGGIKRGFSYGESDDFAYNPGQRPRPCPRLPSHGPAPPRHRPRTPDLQIPRPLLPPHRRAWKSRQ